MGFPRSILESEAWRTAYAKQSGEPVPPAPNVTKRAAAEVKERAPEARPTERRAGTPAADADAAFAKRWLAWVDRMTAAADKMPCAVFVFGYTKNCANNREHWRRVAAREKRMRATAEAACFAARVPQRLPVRVRMVRCGPNRMDAGCGLNTGLKPVRDGVADHFGPDDDDARYAWEYAQERAPRGCHGVRIEFTYGKGKGKESGRCAAKKTK